MIVGEGEVPEVFLGYIRKPRSGGTAKIRHGERVLLAAVGEEETYLPLVSCRLVPVSIGHELLFVEDARIADRIAALPGERQ